MLAQWDLLNLGVNGRYIRGYGVPKYELLAKAENSLAAEERYHLLKDVPTAYREETIDRLVAQGIIRGRSGEGDDLVLDLGEDAVRILIYLDRAGVFLA